MRQDASQETEQSDSSHPSAAALAAVQIALDRRDNGGRTADSDAQWNQGR